MDSRRTFVRWVAVVLAAALVITTASVILSVIFG